MKHTDINRQNYIDIARGIGILAMVIVHSAPPLILQKVIFSFTIPAFFILSGYLYDSEKWNKLGTGVFVKKRIKLYIVPYFLLSGINLIINLPFEMYSGINGNDLIKLNIQYLIGILYSISDNNKLPNCIPLWFLPCLFLGGIFFHLIMKCKSGYIQVGLCCLAVIVFLLYAEYVTIELPWHLPVALLGVMFMYIGSFAKHKLKIEMVSNKLFLFVLMCAIGLYSAFTNGIADLNYHFYGGNIILLLISGASLSIAIIMISLMMERMDILFRFWGRNTLCFMALNLAASTYLGLLWTRIFSSIELSWWLLSIIDMLIISLICLAKDHIKKIMHRKTVVN